MYVRFVVHSRNEDSHRREGLFHAAGTLRDSGELTPAESDELKDVWDWFGKHLERPGRFARSRRPHAHPEALSWFKPTALEHIQRMRQLADILCRHGIQTEMLSQMRPGYVVYEDDYQIAAVPFRDTLT